MADTSEGTASLSILVVDDEVNIRKTLGMCLEADGHRVTTASSRRDALEAASQRSFDLAFVDLRLGTSSGLDLIPPLLGSIPGLRIVVITAYASIETAVEAMRRGAVDYLPKPFAPAQVRIAIRKIGELRALEHKVEALTEELKRSTPEAEFTTRSPAMARALDLAEQAAPTDATMLLRGESGTGKTVLARAIHAWSRRAGKPLGVVSCPSLASDLLETELFGHAKGAFTGAVRHNPGRIAASEGGTLFLDEIGDLPLSLQPKLLRFVQEREYENVGDHRTRRADVRIIVATNVDLEAAIKEGRFREDLFYRLNVIQIEIPPLRERPEDLVNMAERLLAFFGASYNRGFLGFTDEALEALKGYEWPGNLRELRNVCERAAILCRGQKVGVEHLPSKMVPAGQAPRLGDPIPLKQIEELHIRRVLATTTSLQEAADILGIDQATLWRKRKQYDV